MPNGRVDTEFFDALGIKERRDASVFLICPAANKAHAVRSHEAGNGGAYHFASEELFKSA